ncbi:MAG: N-acetylmuramoyl-L-alanine amidase [Candidatus Kuenenia sp.]|nr:N-acetylmuramoyl-L-alanine amidase [Candidatus Kuenenia hertensis]
MTNTKNRTYEKMIQRISLAFMVAAGGVIGSLPVFNGKDADAKVVKVKNDILETAFAQNISQVCDVGTKERHWQYIVIHHSASEKGNATRFDTYHRKHRGWEHGLAYHFVIGNGSLSGDGEIEVGNRWKEQIHGAHTANMDCNKVGIGICLVGDFENGGVPTGNQFDSLIRLTRYLSWKYDIPLSNIILHSQVHQKGTACPGKNFPLDEFKTSLIQIASNEISPARKS